MWSDVEEACITFWTVRILLLVLLPFLKEVLIVKNQGIQLRILNLSIFFQFGQSEEEGKFNFSCAFQTVLEELELCIFLQTLNFSDLLAKLEMLSMIKKCWSVP